MAVVVKQEPSDDLDLEEKIILVCSENANGASDAIFQKAFPQTSASQRVTAINRLLSRGKLEVLKQGKTFLYRVKDPEAAKSVKGADNEERLVYKIIEEAGNKGIWIRDIRFKSNLLLTQVNKILKNLESKKYIKAVKSVSASKKKVYMVFNLEPDCSVTGGAWYSDQGFDSEFVEVLNHQCYRFLNQKLDMAKDATNDPTACRNTSYSSSEHILKFINDLGISKVQLSVEDIEVILNTLIYDGKVEKSIVPSADGTQKNLYRVMEALIESCALMRMPCGVCPISNDCGQGVEISPSTCQYMKDWYDY